MTTAQAARILVLVSSPLDASINVGDGLARLREAVADLPYAAQFDVYVAEAEQVGDLLARADRPPYDVVHYLGHGDLLQDGVGVLWFEDEAGQARAMRDINLGTTLQPAGKPEFKLALISACHSESVVPAMLALGIRHVVAVEADQSVYELAAVAFYRRFYLALLTGASVSEAFTAGCRAVFNEPKLGAAAAAEAAKFKLLPEGGSHEERLFAGLPSGQMTFNDLPALTDYPFDQQPVAYVGRNEDMHKLIAQLNARRAASVIGPSGVGKTELARQVARWLVARRRFRPERVGFASLANIRAADEARAQVARALGLKPDDIRDDGALRQQCPPDFLLIVDEAEGVIQGDGFNFRNTLNALIGAPARPHVIVTSQTDPNTPHAPPLPVQRLSDDAAFRLFALNAGLSADQLRLISHDDLWAVLAFVDRLPRAIELVARVWGRERGGNPDNLDLRPLLAALRAKHDQVMRDPDYPEAVKSVTVGIQLAYDRLRAASEDAARLYAYLGLFPGGVSKAGLSAIFGAQAADQATLIQAQSLVEMPFAHFPPPLNDLLSLPAPFAAFARRQLPDGEGAARRAIGAAVLRWYLDAEVPSLEEAPVEGWVNLLDAHLRGGGQATGAYIARYDAERPSIEAWLDWGYANEQCGDGLSRSARLTAGLQNLYVVTNVLHLPETKRRLESALASARRCGDRLGEANVLQALGDLLLREGDLKGARAQYEAALASYRQIGPRLGEANTLRALGDLLLREGDLKGARAQYEAALASYRLGEANVLQALGDLLLREGDLKGARAQYEAALASYRLGEANVLKALGDLLLREDDLKGARAQYEAALASYRQIGARLGEANVLQALGDLLLREDDLKGARAQYEAALASYRQIGDRLGEANTLRALGDLLLREDDLKGARAQYEAALASYRQIGDRLGEANTLKARGDLKRREDDLQGARQDYDAALPIYRAIGDRLGEANTLRALGNLALAEKRIEDAVRQCSEAATIYQAINDRLGLAGALYYLARALRAAGQPAQAVLYGEAALGLLRAIGERFGQCLALDDQGDALYELRLAEPAFAAWWLALAQHVSPPTAQCLRGIFDQLQQALGDAEFDGLVARLNQDAEGIRLAGVRQARAAALAAANELFEAKRYDEARAAFQRIVDALPDDADALNGLGNALELLGRYAEALEAYSRAVMAQPGVAMLRRNRANLLLWLGRYDEAAQDVAEAVRLEPDHPFTRARQGGLALARGQFAEAQAHFAAAIAARPDDSAGWQALRALASLGLGEVAAAQQAIAALAPRLDDDDRAEALLWLERLVAARLDLAAAAAVIRAALSAGSG
jgi:tetratricopeptide (TPR) repeat protein